MLIETVAEAIDTAALRIMERLWLSGGDPLSSREREGQRAAIDRYASKALLENPSAFFPEPLAPEVKIISRRRIRGGAIERCTWPSGYRTWDQSYQSEYSRYEENGFGHAEHFRHDRPGAPAIICIHSWATGMYPLQREAFPVRRLYRLGFDVVLFILPFHGPRTPAAARFGGQLFPGTSIQRTNEGFGHLVFDVRAFVRYLERIGAGAIGVMGMSLGGYASALLAAIEPKLSFSVPMIPLVSWADLLWKHGEGHPKRKEAEATGISLEQLREAYAVHTPLRYPPRVERDARLIIAGRGDRVTPPDHVNLLWEHWERPRIEWFAGGHIAHFGRHAPYRALGEFLARFVGAA